MFGTVVSGTVLENTIAHTGQGIYLNTTSTGNLIRGNTIGVATGGTTGVSISANSPQNNVVENTVYGPDGSGCFTFSSASNLYSLNRALTKATTAYGVVAGNISAGNNCDYLNCTH
jgi:parallel beta-helix repeat protein